ncbi:hypothetical protein [Streptomyces sp. SGAir0957]
MRGFFVDNLLMITPMHHTDGVRLYGEVMGAHRIPLALAVTDCARTAQEITVDLTSVDYLSSGALQTLVAVARSLRAPQYLCIHAGPELRLAERCAQHGWDQLDTLRLRCP